MDFPRFSRHASITPTEEKTGAHNNHGKMTQRYSTEFKVKAVEWSHQAHRSVQGVAEALDIHPFMLSRWRKEYREGKFAMKRVKKAPADAKQKIHEQDEVARLKRRVSELQKENDILKKFQRFRPRNDGSVPVRLETPGRTRSKDTMPPPEYLAIWLLCLG